VSILLHEKVLTSCREERRRQETDPATQCVAASVSVGGFWGL